MASLAGKPAGLFSASQALHGGQESTLLTMAMPLLHHGMLLVGIPFTERALNQTRTGGTPYGATHVAGLAAAARPRCRDDEIALAQALGTARRRSGRDAGRRTRRAAAIASLGIQRGARPSITSRMNGTVRRRCATKAASSSVSRISHSVRMSRGKRRCR